MSYNGSGTFQINTSGQPVVTGTSISSTVFNALTADLATGLSTAITKDGQTTTTARIPFALGINSTLVTDATNTTSGSIITAGGVGIAKNVYVGSAVQFVGSTSGSVGLQAKAVAGSTTFKLPSADGTSNQAMVTDGSGNLSFATVATTPGGSTTQVQYNNAGAFAGITGATTNGTALTLTGAILNGTIGATTPSTGAFTTVSATSSISASNNQNAVSTLATFNNNTQGTGAVTEVYLTDNTTGTMRFNVFSGSYTTAGLFDYASGAKIFHSGSGGLSVGASGGNLTLFSGSNSAVLSSTGLKTATTISVGAATPSTSGAGITFPATQSASSDANTLDDYEEGTWTPVAARYTGGSITAVYGGSNAGKYTKIGRLVTIECYLEITSVSSQGSSLSQITGLPFLPPTSYRGTGAVFFNTAATTINIVSGSVNSGDSCIYLHESGNNATLASFAWTAGSLNITISYSI
jgi:hypothetical protein